MRDPLLIGPQVAITEVKGGWVKPGLYTRTHLAVAQHSVELASRQERRKAERDAAKAPAQAGSAGARGAGGAVATRANVNANPLGDWRTQAANLCCLMRSESRS